MSRGLSLARREELITVINDGWIDERLDHLSTDTIEFVISIDD